MTNSQPPRVISIRGFLIAMLVVAIVATAMARDDPIWIAVATNLHLAAIIASIAYGIYSHGPRRAFFWGFACCDAFFMTLEFVPSVGRPLVNRLLAYQLLSPDAANALPIASYQRAYMGMMLTSFIYSICTAVLAARLAAASPSPSSKVSSGATIGSDHGQ